MRVFKKAENAEKEGPIAELSASASFGSAALECSPALLFIFAVMLLGLRTAWGWAAFSLAMLLPGKFFANKKFHLPGGLWLWFFGWLGLCALLSPEPLNSLSHFSKYPVLAVFFSLSASLADSARARRAWLLSVFGTAAVLAAVIFFQRFAGRGVYGLIGANPNYSAAILAGAFCAALVFTFSQSGRRKALCALMAAAFLCAVIATNSRGALLASIASASAYFWAEKRWRTLACLCAVLAFAAAAGSHEALAILFKTGDPKAYARLWLWASAAQAALSSPFFGFGPGLFEKVFEVFKFPWFNGISYYGHSSLHAHSEILNLAVEGGLPAAALYAAAVWSGLKEKSRGGFQTAMKFCALALFVQGFVDIVFYSGAVSLLFFGCLGFCPPQLAESETLSGRARFLRPAALALLLLCLFGFSARIVFERNAAIALQGASPEALRRARAFAPLQKDLLLQEAVWRLSTGGNAALAAAFSDNAASVCPADPRFPYISGEAFIRGGNFANAAARFEAALAIEPGFAAARLKLSRLFLSGGKNKEAALQAGLAAKIFASAPKPGSVYDMLLVRPPVNAPDVRGKK